MTLNHDLQDMTLFGDDGAVSGAATMDTNTNTTHRSKEITYTNFRRHSCI